MDFSALSAAPPAIDPSVVRGIISAIVRTAYFRRDLNAFIFFTVYIYSGYFYFFVRALGRACVK